MNDKISTQTITVTKDNFDDVVLGSDVPVLVDFWAEWCGPCKAEIPALNRFAKKNPDVPVIGIAVDSGNLDAVTAHAERLGIRYPVVRGTSAVQRAYGVSVLPTSFLIGADGTIEKSHVGLITRPQLAAWAP